MYALPEQLTASIEQEMWLHNLVFLNYPNFEDQFIDQLAKEHGRYVKGEVRPYVYERYLMVQIQSPWKMQESTQGPSQFDFDEKRVDMIAKENNFLWAANSVKIRYLNHPLIALSFRLVYSAKIPQSGGKPNLERTYTIAFGEWLPEVGKGFNFSMKGGP